MTRWRDGSNTEGEEASSDAEVQGECWQVVRLDSKLELDPDPSLELDCSLELDTSLELDYSLSFTTKKLGRWTGRSDWKCPKKENKTSQELRMLSSVTLNRQVTKIVMNSGSQLSEL